MVFHCLFIRVSGSGFTGELWFFYLAFGLFFVTMLSRLVLLLYFSLCPGHLRYNFVVNASVEGFWFAQLTMCSSLVCNLVFLRRSALCSGNHLFSVIVHCFLFEL